MKIRFLDTLNSAPHVIVCLVAEDGKFPTRLAALDKSAGGQISKAAASVEFKGKKGQAFSVPAVAKGARVVVMGVGNAAKFTTLEAEKLGGRLVPSLNAVRAKSAQVVVELPKGVKPSAAAVAAHMAYGATLKSYRFDKYKTKLKAEDKPTLAELVFTGASARAAQTAFAPLQAVAEGILFARDLVTEPGNVIYPETLAAACKSLSKLGVEVKIVRAAEMKKLGMHALLGVGKGSENESLLAVMQWKGGPKTGKAAAPLAFVGKGVTFDTGGIDIKPSNGMWEMKHDMAGAAAVIGLMRALAARKAKANVVGVCGLVENMPDGKAQKQGDVVKSMSGQTIEILNTDAEGRLVLSDALWYAQVTFKPRMVIDLATLTGAVVVALGSSRAGMFANDDALADRLFKAGQETGEELWRLPLGEVYDKQINSDIADMQNIGADREAGSTMGAVFLQRFIKEGTPWAHLDIAGTAWTKKEQDTCPKGATAYGVRLLDHLVSEHYEG